MKVKKEVPLNTTEAETRAYLKEIAKKFAGKDFFPEKTAHARETLKKINFSQQSSRKS